LAARDYELAASFIEPLARPMIFSGQVNQLKVWLNSLPGPVLNAHVQLNIFQVWIDYIQGKRELSDQNLQETDNLVATLPLSPENDRLKVELAVLLCRFVAMSGNSARAINMANEALRHLPEDDQASRARVFSALSIAHGTEGQIEEAELAFRKCFQLAQSSGYYSLLAHTIMLVAMGQSNYGKLQSPARDLQAVLDLGLKTGQSIFYPAGQAYVGLAAIYLEWNDLQTAETYLEKGMELCRQGGLDGIFYGLTIRSRLRQARLDLQGALEDVHLAEETMKRKDYLTISRLVQIQIARRDMLALGQLGEALKPIVQETAGGPRIPPMFVEVIKVCYIRILLAHGEIAYALRLIDDLQIGAEAGGRFGRLIEVHLLRAVALLRKCSGKIKPEALKNMRRALELAEPEGYMRLFLEGGPDVPPMLKAIAQEPATAENLKKYALRLLEAQASERKTTPTAVKEPTFIRKADELALQPELVSLIDPLSKREMDILKLICEGCSNQEIANRLVITLYTVKKHSSNIFDKLGVSSRTQAAVRARHLGLID
jgi:LuxR family maltose regulon positive regulatory protein